MSAGESAFAVLDAGTLPAANLRIRVRIEGWATCSVAGMGQLEWLDNSVGRDEAGPLGRLAGLPAILRRRVSAIGHKAFQAALRLPVGDSTRYVFCSRHGEYGRTSSLLASLASDDPVSPADFSLSVHHALAGLLSIVHANHAGHTAIAAGSDSFGFGLLDAAACLAAGDEKQILLVYFDEPLPEDYAPFREEQDDFAAALLLAPASGNREDLFLSLEAVDERLPRLSATGQAREFIGFIRSEENERTCRGERVQWRWCRAGV